MGRHLFFCYYVITALIHAVPLIRESLQKSPSTVDSKVVSLFEELKDVSYSRRIQAQRQLIQRGVRVEKSLEVLLSRANVTDEQRYRSQVIIEAVWNGKKMSWKEVVRRMVRAIESNRCRFPLEKQIAELAKKFESAKYQNVAFGRPTVFESHEDGLVSFLMASTPNEECELQSLPSGAILPNGKSASTLNHVRLSTADTYTRPTSGDYYLGLRLVGNDENWERLHNQSVNRAVGMLLTVFFPEDRKNVAKAVKSIRSIGQLPLPLKRISL